MPSPDIEPSRTVAAPGAAATADAVAGAGTWLDQLDRADAHAPAVGDETERLTYGDLRRAAGLIAGQLDARFGRSGYLIVPAEPTARFVATLAGVMMSGNTPIPVDPGLPAPALAPILARSGARGVVAPLAPAEYRSGRAVDFRDSSRPALIMFTSGSTGVPKGAVISQANLTHACRAMSEYLEYARYPSAAVALPLHYSYALLSQVFCQLFVGGRVRLFRDLRNPLKFAQQVDAEGLETFCGVPSTYHALSVFHALRPLTITSIRVLCSAGAAMDRARFATVKAIFPHAAFFNNYGMTEAAPRIAWVRDDDPRFDEGTCGRPMAGVDVKIVDPDSGRTLPDRQPGMLVVRGPNVTAGYLNDPATTRDAFTADGYLISGDIAHLDRGYIFIHGRHDDIFNSGGEKVAPLEIEAVLNRIPGVEAAAVGGAVDDARGMVPVAFLKLQSALTRKTLVQALSEALSKSKVPQRYYEVSGFPMTSNGKLQRRLLTTDAGAAFVLREIL